MEGTGTELFDTIIIGGGQAGLATGYHLKRRGLPFVILDAQERVGDAWRTRWDSLRLFTPARYDNLPGLPFPAPAWSFPTKDEMGDYLATYAERFDLPVRTRVSVDRLTREGDRYVLSAGDRRIEADRVVVSTGANRVPKVPGFASQLSRTHRTWLAGKESGQIPVRHGTIRARLGFKVFRFIGHHVLTLGTPIGRKILPKVETKAAPLIRVRRKDLARAGVQ